MRSRLELPFLWMPLAWAAPFALLAQGVCLILLVYRVVFRWYPGGLGRRRFDRFILQLGVVVAPLLMLPLSAAFQGGYQGERGGHWFFHIHSAWAGLSLVPLYAIGSFIVARAIAKNGRFSKTSFAVLATLFVISVWYTLATLFLDLTREAIGELEMLAIVPALASVNYALVGVDVLRHGRRGRDGRSGGRGLGLWYAGLGASLLIKIPLARQIYAQLPPERPNGYGDCFVVGAAAHGHPWLVGSRYDPSLGRVVNRQWRTLRAFEDALAAMHPRGQRMLRDWYNEWGPRLAGRIRSRAAADLVFLALKPVEWAAALYLSVTGHG